MITRRHSLVSPTAHARGDTSIVTVFLVLAVLILGAAALTVIAIGNLRGATDILPISRALAAADAAVERARWDFFWTNDADGDGNLCTVANDVLYREDRDEHYDDTGGPVNFYDVITTGDRAPVDFPADVPPGLDDGGSCTNADGETVLCCPNPQDINPPLGGGPPTRALCITTFGHGRGIAFRRRFNVDTDPAACRGPWGGDRRPAPAREPG